MTSHTAKEKWWGKYEKSRVTSHTAKKEWWSILGNFEAPSLLLSVLEHYFVFCTLGDYSLVSNILLKYVSVYGHISNIF